MRSMSASSDIGVRLPSLALPRSGSRVEARSPPLSRPRQLPCPRRGYQLAPVRLILLTTPADIPSGGRPTDGAPSLDSGRCSAGRLPRLPIAIERELAPLAVVHQRRRVV